LKRYRTTEIIGPWVDFSMIKPDVLEYAATRGTAVHAGCTCYATGALFTGGNPAVDSYIDSFRRWFDTYVIDVLMTEQELRDREDPVVGHLDLLVTLRDTDDRPRVVDIKTPIAKQKAWGAQLASYKRMVEQMGYTTADSMSLRLMADGSTARGDIYLDHYGDENGFRNALFAGIGIGFDKMRAIIESNNLRSYLGLENQERYAFANAWWYFKGV
jgi:hypothetical protein